jgi:hypothetical protein
MRKTGIRPVVLLVLLLLLLAGQAAAQGPAPPTGTPACPPSHQLPPADEVEIRRLAEIALAGYRPGQISGWDIVNIAGLGEWGIVNIAPLSGQGEALAGDGDILIAHREQGAWQVALPNSEEFRRWLEGVPNELLIPSPGRSYFIVSPGPAAPTTGLYKLPYACDQTALVLRAGPDHDNAADFQIESASWGQDVVVAAQEGWVHAIVQNNTACCCASGYPTNDVILRHPNGEYSYYLHLTANSVTVQVGDYVPQGYPIAREGDVGYTCSSGGPCHTRYCDVPGDMDYCCEHLHFEVRDNGSWQGARLEPRFADVPGEFVQTGQSYTSGNCLYDNTPPTTVHSFSGTAGDNGWYVSPGQVTLSAQDNPGGCGVQSTHFRLDGGGWLTYTVPFTVASAGSHALEYYSRDNCGNQETPRQASLKLDLYDPVNPNAVNPGCDAGNNTWQNRCNDVALAWFGAGDGGSGLRDYHYYWGTDPASPPTAYTANSGYNPAAVPSGSAWFLRLAARDQAGREPSPATLFVLRYDADAPVISWFAIDGGASRAYQVAVRLDLAVVDAASGPWQMRFSNNGLDWSPWQPWASAAAWSLPPLDRHTVTVHAQVRDLAGNVAAAADDIYLDLSPLAPHAGSFRLCAGVVDAGGAAGLTSPSFLLTAAIGQPMAGGSANAGFSSGSGFLSSITGCLPISDTAAGAFTRTRSVVASAGGLRGSGTYRLGDTAGEPAASGVSAFSSTSYLLGSGFWAGVTSTVPAAPPPLPPLPTPLPGPSPTPAPTPLPPPAGFGLLINGGYTFTNRTGVTLTLRAPHVSAMQVSNAAGFGGATWEQYHLTRAWTLSTSLPYTVPTTVYARYRDPAGVVYGDYLDSIVYDPVSPTGSVQIIAAGPLTVTLWLNAADDNSGVEAMRLAGDEAGLPLAPWQPYTHRAVFTPTQGLVYAQFQDRAGNVSRPAWAGEEHRAYLPVVLRGTVGR